MTTQLSAARRFGLALLIATISIAAPSSTMAQGATPDTGYAFRLDTLLDLETVIARTLTANPLVTIGEENVRTARSEGRVATGAYLPSFALNSAALRSDIVTPGTAGAFGPSTAGAYSAGVSSSVELFTGGRRSADRARARADLGAAEANSVSQRFSAILLAQRAYYEALRGTDLIAVADARVARAERGMRYAQDRVRAGTATRSDELRARLELTAGRQQLLAARDTMQTAAFALGRLVGADGPVGARRPASLDPRPLSLSDTQVVRLAVDAAPIVQSTAAAVRATEASTRAARAQFAPDIRLTGGYNWAGQSPVIGAIRPGWTVGVGTSFPVFNGFQREDAVTRADAAAEIARATALDARRLVRAQAASLLGALSLAEQSIGLATEALTAAQEDLRVQTQRYRAGISTSLDQLTSELAVTQAELSLVAARYNYQVTRASLEALVGRTL